MIIESNKQSRLLAFSTNLQNFSQCDYVPATMLLNFRTAQGLVSKIELFYSYAIRRSVTTVLSVVNSAVHPLCCIRLDPL